MFIVIINTLFTIIAVFVFLYFFWKKLKDDYSQTQVFNAGFYSLFGMAFGYLVSRVYLTHFWFWLTLLGSFIGLLAGIYRYRMKFFETLEAWTIGNLNILLIFNLNELIRKVELLQIVSFTTTLLLVLVFFYINSQYKRYVWYRSGKVGFSGLLVAGFYFVFKGSFLMFSGIIDKSSIFEIVFSCILAFVSFILLYNLSRKEN